eukprot:3655569-Rhodomonas_salina.2
MSARAGSDRRSGSAAGVGAAGAGAKSGGASGGKASSLPRADSQGETLFREGSRRDAGSGGNQGRMIHAPLSMTPGELLTENRHHLLPGAEWRMDTGAK